MINRKISISRLKLIQPNRYKVTVDSNDSRIKSAKQYRIIYRVKPDKRTNQNKASRRVKPNK